MNEIEQWKPIDGYEGFYEVSNHGNVRSLSRMTKFGGNEKFVTGRVLKVKKRLKKYPIFILSKENVQVSHSVHRLVAIAFHPNPLNLPCVNHKDGNKDNNFWLNLEWSTYSGNSLHALDTGLNKLRKLTKEDVFAIRASSQTDIELGKIYGVRQGNIWNVKNYKSWKHL